MVVWSAFWRRLLFTLDQARALAHIFCIIHLLSKVKTRKYAIALKLSLSALPSTLCWGPAASCVWDHRTAAHTHTVCTSPSANISEASTQIQRNAISQKKEVYSAYCYCQQYIVNSLHVVFKKRHGDNIKCEALQLVSQIAFEKHTPSLLVCARCPLLIACFTLEYFERYHGGHCVCNMWVIRTFRSSQNSGLLALLCRLCGGACSVSSNWRCVGVVGC